MNFFLKNNFFLIAIGAVPASIFRWQIDQILVVNIIGCFLLGFINALPLSEKYRLILCFGFCGSLTTFSGWSFELFKLLNKGLYKLFFLNSILILILSFFAIIVGNYFAKKIIY